MSDSKQKSKPENQWEPGVGIAMGVAIGSGLGVALGNIAIGMGVGVALGAALDARYAKKTHIPPEKVKYKLIALLVAGAVFGGVLALVFLT